MCHVRRCTRSVSLQLPKRCSVASRRCRCPCHVTIFIIHYLLLQLACRVENHRKSRKRGIGGVGGGQVMKRIPRIKFPERQPNPKPSNSGLGSASQIQAAATKNGDNLDISIPSSDVPTTPMNTAIGGKASLQPKRTPVSDKEIEAILLGGYF